MTPTPLDPPTEDLALFGTMPTPTEAAHVLSIYGEGGGMVPGDFITSLIRTMQKADQLNLGRLATLWPGYATAVDLVKNTEDGLARVQAIADGGV